jgi:hypothetical protein
VSLSQIYTTTGDDVESLFFERRGDIDGLEGLTN